MSKTRYLCASALCLLFLLGCDTFARHKAAGTSESPGTVRMRFHVGSTNEVEGYQVVADEHGQPVYIAPHPFLTDADVWHADVLTGNGTALVLLEFTEMGATALEWVTQRRTGSRLAVFVDDELVMSPLLRAPITGGKVYLNGEFSVGRARAIANGLNAQRSARSPVSKDRRP